MRLGGFDDVVQALQPIGAGVNACYPVHKGLIVHSAGAGDAGDIVESPDAKDFLPRGLEVLHHGIDIGVVGQEADPVRVGSGKVLLLAVNDEGGAASGRYGARGRGGSRRGCRS